MEAMAQDFIATPSDLRDGEPSFIGPPVIVPIAECSASVFVSKKCFESRDLS